MNWKEIMSHDERINGTIQRAFDGGGWVPVEDRTPAEILMAEEPDWDVQEGSPREPYGYPSDEVADLELRALKMAEALQVAQWARRRQMEWLLGGGVHPFRVMQRFYCLAWGFFRDLLGEVWTGDMLAEMMGQGKAAFSAAMKRLFGPIGEALCGEVVKVSGQKSAGSAAAYAENARKHKPKQKLHDSASTEEAEAALLRRAAEVLEQKKRDLPRLRKEAERRELARELGCKPEEIDLDKIRVEF
jgi:hypothetical protein